MGPTPHDALFRGIFGQAEHAAAELAAALPRQLLAELDLATLRALPSTFVDAALAERHADLLFEVALRRGGGALVYLLMEHQSASDAWMPLRLISYQLRIWEQWRREHPDAPRLPAIVPIVVHHGEGTWSAPRRFADLVDLSVAERTALGGHVIDFEAIVDDLSAHEPAALARRGMAQVARLALVALRTARDDEEFRRQVGLLARLLRDARERRGSAASVALVLRYLFELRARTELREVEALDVERGVDAMGRKVVSWAEEERMLGREEGRTDGRREALIELAAQRFGALSGEQRAALERADAATLERAVRRILGARSFEELLAP